MKQLLMSIFNLLFFLALCAGIAVWSSCSSHYPAYDHYLYKPESNKIYDTKAGRFDYEWWHGEDDDRLNCEM